MAGFQPAQPGVIEVVLRFKLFGIPVAIIIHVRLNSGLAPTPGQVNAVASTIQTWMTAEMMPNLSSELTLVQIQATDISTSTGFQAVLDESTAGGVIESSLPSQIAAVISLRTALRGRSYRGRSFLPGIPLSYQTPTGGAIKTASQSDLLTAYNALDGHLTGVSATQVVLSRRQLKFPLITALAQPVTSRTIDDTFDTLRRRGANAHRSG